MLRLVDRGFLDLDEDVNDRLTSWRLRPTSDWQPVVTLRQLEALKGAAPETQGGAKPFLPAQPPVTLGGSATSDSEAGPWGPHRK